MYIYCHLFHHRYCACIYICIIYICIYVTLVTSLRTCIFTICMQETSASKQPAGTPTFTGIPPLSQLQASAARSHTAEREN